MRASLSYRKDYYAGALIVLIGLWASFERMQFQIGTLEQMGPGFFPAAIGALMVIVGLAIAIGARPNPEETGDAASPEWRGWICIIGGIVAFMILGAHGGLLPATFALVFVSALGDRSNTIKEALLLAVAMTLISAIVFRWALQLQLPMFAWS